MPNKFVGAAKFLASKFKKKGTVAPTITQPRQLKTTMKKIRSQFEKHGLDKAKTATDRANIVRRKKSIERMDKLDKAKAKRKEGIKASKEIKKMIDTGQADKVGSNVYHRGVREKKAMGGPASGRDMRRLKEGLEKLKGRGKKSPEQRKGDTGKQRKKAPFNKPDKLKDRGSQPKEGRRGKKFPDLTGDGKVTQADILKGRGVFRKGGASK